MLLAPDLSMVGYLRDTNTGAMIYNIIHFYALPASLLAASLAEEWTLGILAAAIWLAHIGIDRFSGYGLKYPTEFKDTHLGRV